MLEKLYNFKKGSNHVKFFKWIWGVDPTDRYNTMCPYFWSYVATIIFLPIILLFKVLGGAGNSINLKLLNYKNNRSKKLKEGLVSKIEALSKLNHSDEDVLKKYYDIRNSKCFENFEWSIPYDLVRKVKDFSNEYHSILMKAESLRLQEKSEKARKVNYVSIKENKVLKYIAMGIAIVGALFLVYFIGLFIIFAYNVVPWVTVFIIIAGLLLALVLLYVVSKYIFEPFYEKVLCKIEWNKTWVVKASKWIWFNVLGTIGRGLINGIIIFIDMVKSQYEQSCPIITWEE